MSPSSISEESRRSFRVLVAANGLVFLSSAFIMTLELVAARLVAAFLGVSLYTWTSVIGVVLAGISLGNYVGGKLADIYPPRKLLPALFLLASVLSLTVLFLVDWLGTWQRPEWMSWPLWILQNVSITFLLPACLLGTISPVVSKAALEVRRQIGSTVGSLYAAGAAGSILGTFLTGYVLIDLLGTRTIVCGIAAGLGLLSLLTAWGQRRAPTPFLATWLVLVIGVSLLAVGPWPWAERWGYFLMLRLDESHILYQDESAYFEIEIYEAEELDDTRVLALDHLVHSYVAMDDPTRLEYGYETVYAALTVRLAPRDRPPRALFIGGGGYSFPRWMEARHPAARIDVAEIDPAVKRAAQEALGLPPDGETRIRTWAMDARNLIADLRARRTEEDPGYDFVYGDAFNDLGVPYHLTTREFNDSVRELLTPAGVYMVNVIDIYREGMAEFLGAFVTTLRRTFPAVYVFSGELEGYTDERDTFVVVGSGEPLRLHDLGVWTWEPVPQGTLFAWAEGDELGGEMPTLLARGRGVVLTDDYAPVDNMLAPVFAAQAE